MTVRKAILAFLLPCVAFAAAGGVYDVNVADYPRLTGETDDAPRFMRAISAAPNGVVCVPKGEYDIASMLYITNRCSLSMHPAAHLVARAKMKYVVFWDGAADYHALSVYNPDSSIYDNANLFIKGGDIDGNGLASCLALANSHHFTLSDITLHNGVVSGLCVTRETGGHLYEFIANNVYCKCTMSGLAGNVGIDCQVSDCHFTDCIVVDYTKGIRSAGGANRFSRCHVWGGTVPPKGMGFKEWSDFYARRKKLETARKWTADDERDALSKGVPEMLPGSIAFECIGGANVFDGCYADTSEIGFDVRRDATIINSGFYNNPRMNLRKSMAIVHRGGHLGVPFIVLMSQATTYVTCCAAMFVFGVFRGAYDSNNFAAFFDVVEPRYHASAAGFNLMIAFLFGCFSPTVLGWTKANYSMSTGLASLAVAYLVGAILIAFAGRTHLWFQRAWKSTR